MYQLFFPLKKWMKVQNISERALATNIGLSRFSLRALYQRGTNFTLNTLLKVAQYFEQDVAIISYSSETIDSNTVATSYRILRDGFDSWKIHIMDMVDEFRRSLDIRILLLPPAKESDERIKALMASVVQQLCHEAMIEAPLWARKTYYLNTPWFVSEVEALKAFALLESPIFFKKNNIFVLNNFLERA